jgi:hypothetical protein
MLCKCEGHSSYITHIDWSVDSRVLMSNCGAYDLLHFDPRSGRKLKKAQNDTIWDTWTCASQQTSMLLSIHHARRHPFACHCTKNGIIMPMILWLEWL